MLSRDRAQGRADRRRRIGLVSLVVGVVAGLSGAPFVLSGCFDPRPLAIQVGEPTQDPDTGETAFPPVEANPIAPVNDVVYFGPVAATGHDLVDLDFQINGTPVTIIDTIDPTVTAAIEAAAEAQGFYTPGAQTISILGSDGPVSIQAGDDLSLSYQANGPFGPATTPQFSVVVVFADDLGTAPLVLHFVPNPAAFTFLSDPNFAPVGAVAWEIEHPTLPHFDGPFALPGAPNLVGYPVLHPLQIPLYGMFWVEPHIPFCKYWHAHGVHNVPGNVHGDPDGGGCGHGAFKWISFLDMDVDEPADGLPVLVGQALDVSGTSSTTGRAVDRVEVRIDGNLLGTATGGGAFNIPITVPPFTANGPIDLTVTGFDWDGASGSQTIELDGVAPLDLSFFDPAESVLAGEVKDLGVEIFHGAPNYSVTTRLDDVIIADLTGPGPTFPAGFVAAKVAVPTLVTARVDVTDAMDQTLTRFLPVTISPILAAEFSALPPSVPAGAIVPVELTATGTAVSGTFFANGAPFDAFAGGGGTYLTNYATTPSPVTIQLDFSAEVFDGAFSQQTTVTAVPIFVIGSNDAIQSAITSPLPGIEVLEGTILPVIGQLSGGYNGFALARLYADGQQEAAITTPTGSAEFDWEARIPGAGIQGLPLFQGEGQGQGSPGVPVALTIDAVDSVGQVGTSAPVVVYVLPAGGQIPALGGAALAALAALVAGVGIRATLRRPRG
jgi:hypothetical protein